jgi:hypothetical protein
MEVITKQNEENNQLMLTNDLRSPIMEIRRDLDMKLERIEKKLEELKMSGYSRGKTSEEESDEGPKGGLVFGDWTDDDIKLVHTDEEEEQIARN